MDGKTSNLGLAALSSRQPPGTGAVGFRGNGRLLRPASSLLAQCPATARPFSLASRLAIFGGNNLNFGQWLGLASLVLSLYILWAIRQLLLLIFTAVVFTTALNRLVRRIQGFGCQRSVAMALSLFLCCLVAFLFFWLVVPPFIAQFQKLLDLLPQVWERVRLQLVVLRQQQQQLDWLPPLPPLTELFEQFQPLGTELFKNFFAIFSNSVIAALQLLFVLVLTLMMLANPPTYRRAFLALFPSFYRRRADVILTRTEDALSNWLTGTLISSSLVGLLSGFGLSLLQVPLVLVHALLAGLLNLIPNIGPTASVIFPIAIVLLDAPWKVGAILILYFIIQNLESYLLTPTVMAQQVSLLPAVTLLSQIFFAQLFGFLGLLLALPLAVVAKNWLEEVLFIDILDRWQSPANPALAVAIYSEKTTFISPTNDENDSSSDYQSHL